MENEKDPRYCAGCDTETIDSEISLSDGYEGERLVSLDLWAADGQPTVERNGLCTDCAQIRRYSPGPHGERLRQDFPG